MSRKRPDKKKGGHSPQTPATPEEEQPGGFRQSWEYRSVRFVLRIVAVLFFLGYIGFTMKSAITWVETKWVRAQPLDRLPRLADHYLNKVYKPHKLYDWVSMRHPRDTEEVIKKLEPFTGRLSTFTFIWYAMQLKQQGRTQEAMFWWQFARYRARFDALRCGSVKAVENLGELLDLLPHPEFPPEMTPESPEVVRTVIDALDYDARYPADNLPEDLCEALRALEPGKYASVPVTSWANIRYTLRYMTEYRIREMEKKRGVEYKGSFPPPDAGKEDAAPPAEEKKKEDEACKDNAAENGAEKKKPCKDEEKEDGKGDAGKKDGAAP